MMMALSYATEVLVVTASRSAEQRVKARERKEGTIKQACLNTQICFKYGLLVLSTQHGMA